MQLLTHLLARIVLVGAFCLATATGLLLVDAHRDMGRATRTSADRAVARLQALYWQDLLWRDGLSRSALLPRPDWRTLDMAAVLAPGVCLSFARPGEDAQRLCNTATGGLAPAPAWFAALDHRLFGAFADVRRPLDVRSRHAGDIGVSADPTAALDLAFARVASAAWVAAGMTGCLLLAIGLVVARTLRPIGAVTARLRLMQQADYAPVGGARAPFEFGRIGDAVDALAARLAKTEEARTALTRRLFQVQEEERRALARDLHDEFGQCLFAVGACAASIEAGSNDRPDLAADARVVSGLARRMMTTLRDALVRLRSQDVDELGLEAALRDMISRADGRAGAAVSLDVAGDLAEVPRPVAIDLFRVAQECLTNATRHAAARHIRLAVSTAGKTVSLDVEDDGGGDLDAVRAGAGLGLLGVRERIAALGGDLVVARARAGLHVAATIPYALTAGTPAAA